jgi:hypothetical protein
MKFLTVCHLCFVLKLIGGPVIKTSLSHGTHHPLSPEDRRRVGRERKVKGGKP